MTKPSGVLRRVLTAFLPACFALLNAACGPGVFSAAPPPVELHIAAAANLQTIFGTLAAAELKATGIHLVPSFGSTAQLTKQIEAGAPYDIFLAADTEHPTALAAAALTGGVQEYALGRIVIWAPKHPEIRTLNDLTQPGIKVVAVANPDLAPYGHAAIESLDALHLLSAVKPKIVYGENISATLNYAETGICGCSVNGMVAGGRQSAGCAVGSHQSAPSHRSISVHSQPYFAICGGGESGSLSARSTRTRHFRKKRLHSALIDRSVPSRFLNAGHQVGSAIRLVQKSG